MKVKWYINDGYAGQPRVHYTEINEQDLIKCKTDCEKQDLIDEIIQNDFAQKINWYRD